MHVQSLVAETMRADIRGDLHKVEIGGPVAKGVGTAKGQDCKGAGVVDGHVTRHACEETGTARQKERGDRQHEQSNDREPRSEDEAKRLQGVKALDLLFKFVNRGHVIRGD